MSSYWPFGWSLGMGNWIVIVACVGDELRLCSFVHVNHMVATHVMLTMAMWTVYGWQIIEFTIEQLTDMFVACHIVKSQILHISNSVTSNIALKVLIEVEIFLLEKAI